MVEVSCIHYVKIPSFALFNMDVRLLDLNSSTSDVTGWKNKFSLIAVPGRNWGEL
jgi:hypothetical protein